MHINKNRFVVAVDIDGTLIDWFDPNPNVTITCNGVTRHGKILERHVERVKQHVLWGDSVCVWTKSGMEFAEEVVKVLGLKDYVDLVMSKPFVIYDDKTPDKWIGEHRFMYDKKEN